MHKSLCKSRRRFRRVKRNRFASVDQKTSKTYQAGIFLKNKLCEIQNKAEDKTCEKICVIELAEKVAIPMSSLNSENDEKNQTDSVSDKHDIETKPFVHSMDPTEHVGIFEYKPEMHVKIPSESLEISCKIVTSVYSVSYHKTSFLCICQFEARPFYRSDLDVLQKTYKILSQESYKTVRPWQKSYLEIRNFAVQKTIPRPDIRTLTLESKSIFIIKPGALKEHPINITVFRAKANFGPTCQFPHLDYQKNPLTLTKISAKKISNPITSLQLCRYKPCLKPILTLYEEYSQQTPQKPMLSSDEKTDFIENVLKEINYAPIEESIFELKLSNSELLTNMQNNTFLEVCMKKKQANPFEQNLLGFSNALDESEFYLLSSEMNSESCKDGEKKEVYLKHLDEINSESDDEYQMI